MKTSEAYGLFQALTRISADSRPTPVRFSYAVAVNTKRLYEIAEAFEVARNKIISDFSKTGDDGLPLVENDMYQLADTAAFTAAFTDLQNAEVEVSLVKVGLEHLPETIEPSLMNSILPMVSEPA